MLAARPEDSRAVLTTGWSQSDINAPVCQAFPSSWHDRTHLKCSLSCPAEMLTSGHHRSSFTSSPCLSVPENLLPYIHLQPSSMGVPACITAPTRLAALPEDMYQDPLLPHQCALTCSTPTALLIHTCWHPPHHPSRAHSLAPPTPPQHSILWPSSPPAAALLPTAPIRVLFPVVCEHHAPSSAAGAGP